MSIYSLDYYSTSEVPIGTIIPYTGSNVPNPLYLLCDGSSFDAATYKDLYALLGSASTPDLRDCTVYGHGAGIFSAMLGTIVSNFDTNSIKISEDSLPAHDHMGGETNLITSIDGEHTHAGSTSASGAISHGHVVRDVVEPNHNHGRVIYEPTLTRISDSLGAATGALSAVHSDWINSAPGRIAVWQTLQNGTHNHYFDGNGTHTHKTSEESVHTHEVTLDSAGSSEPIDVSSMIPPTYIVNFLIKALNTAV